MASALNVLRLTLTGGPELHDFGYMSSHSADPIPEPDPAASGAHGQEPDGLVDFDIDLTFEESRRRVEVIAALGDDWDPVEVIRGEDAAYAALYSGLDAQQERIYNDLVAAGVLPERGTGRAAH